MGEYFIRALGLSEALQMVIKKPPPLLVGPKEKSQLIQAILEAAPEGSVPIEPSLMDTLVTLCAEHGDSSPLATLFTNVTTRPSQAVLDSSLLTAISRGNTPILTQLITHGANPNYDNGTPLITAAVKGLQVVLESLLALGADATLGDSAALRAAAVSENADARIIARLMLSGADVTAKAYEAPRKAAMRGDPEVMAVMAVAVGNFAKAGSRNWEARSVLKAVLEILVREGKEEAITTVLKDKSVWSWDGGMGEMVRPLLDRAIQGGDVEVVRAIALSGDCWRELIRGGGGKDLLLAAAAVTEESIQQYHEANAQKRKRREENGTVATGVTVKATRQQISDNPAAAMVEAMISGVAHDAIARFRAAESEIGVDAWEFIRKAESPLLHSIKDQILLQAAWHGHETVLDAVISILQPDVKGNAGTAALLAATSQGHIKVVAGLISAGVDFEAGAGEIFKAAEESGHKDVLKHLRLKREIRVKSSMNVIKKDTVVRI
ncbi:hypothetical protein HDU76_010913 [Blyttiomyces sp. JEL0837]|nr:hypothetical protein HDU76_010913 [Blyttiomyces sp. JEL0837]